MPDDFAALDSVLNSMDNQADTSNTDTQDVQQDVDTQDTDTQTSTESNTDAQSEGDQSTGDQQQTTQQDNRGAQAFAAMRSENTALKNLLKRVAGTAGLGNLSGEALVKALEDKLIKDEAKANNIPEELQRKLQEQDTILRSIADDRQRTRVFTAFQDLQTKCNLSSDQVYAFVEELKTKGYDMDKSLDNLPDIYRGLHFEELTKSMIDNAVAEAIKRQQKGEQQGSNPGTSVGNQDQDDEGKVTTVAGLDALLKDVKL